ncbi:uncharacterized protein [Ptychodera flava]|uniref:uncharacterized protein isoform X2 n=1 Tax=Ptychodera flava TaxID=63121 RepID=UPI00396A3DA9
MLKWRTLGKWFKNDSDSNGLLTTISGSRNHGNYGNNLVFATATSPKISESLKAEKKQSGQCREEEATDGSGKLVALLQSNKENVDARLQQQWLNFINDVDQLSEWLNDIVGQAESWKPATGDVNSLRVHLERHLAFAIEIETHQAAKDRVVTQGQEFKSSLPQTSQYLEKTLAVIESQWEQLQNQIDVQYQQIEDALGALESSISASDYARVVSPLSMEQTRDAVDHLTFKLHSKKRKNSPMASQISALNKQLETFSNGQSFDSILNGSTVDTVDHDDNGDNTGDSSDASQVVGEFEGQCQEMFDFLNEMQLVITEKDSDVLVNQKYYKEICKEYKHEMDDLEVTRRTLNSKGHRLMTTYPNLTSEITSKLSDINEKWDHLHDHVIVESTSSTPSGSPSSMLGELDEILVRLRVWLNDVECQLFNVNYNKCLNSADVSELEKKLEEHQALQADIEKHARGVTAVLTLCDILQDDTRACNTEKDKKTLELAAINLDRRWQAILLQAIDLRSKLEEKVKAHKGSAEGLDQNSAPQLNDAGPSTASATCSVTVEKTADSVFGPIERASALLTPSKIVEGLVDYEYDCNQMMENEDLLMVRKAFSENDAFSVSDISDITVDDELLFDDVLLMKDQEDDESSLERELQFDDEDIFDESGHFADETFPPEDDIFPMEDISQEDMDKVQKMRDLASKRQKKVKKPGKRKDSSEEEEKEVKTKKKNKKKKKKKSKGHGKFPSIKADPDIKVVDGKLKFAEDYLSKSPMSGRSSSHLSHGNFGRPTQRKSRSSSCSSSPRDEVKIVKPQTSVFRKHQQIEEKFPKSVDAVTKAVEEALEALMPHRLNRREKPTECELADIEADEARMWEVLSQGRGDGFATSLMTPEGSPGSLNINRSQSLSSCSPRSEGSFSSYSLSPCIEQAKMALEDEHDVALSEEELETPTTRVVSKDRHDDNDMVDGIFQLDLSDEEEEDYEQYVFRDVTVYSPIENILSESLKLELNFIDSQFQDVAAEVAKAETQMFDEMLSKGMLEQQGQSQSKPEGDTGDEDLKSGLHCTRDEDVKPTDGVIQRLDNKGARKRKLFPSLLCEDDRDTESKMPIKQTTKFFPSLIDTVEEQGHKASAPEIAVQPIVWTPPSVKIECVDDVKKEAKRKVDLKLPKAITMARDSDEPEDGERMVIYPLLSTPRTPIFSPGSEDGETMVIYPLLCTPRTPVASPLCLDGEKVSGSQFLTTPRASVNVSFSAAGVTEAYPSSKAPSLSFKPATEKEEAEILAALVGEERLEKEQSGKELSVAPPLVKSTDQFEYPKTPKTPSSPCVSPWTTPRLRAPQPPSPRDPLSEVIQRDCVVNRCEGDGSSAEENSPIGEATPAVVEKMANSMVVSDGSTGIITEKLESDWDADSDVSIADVNSNSMESLLTSEWSSKSLNVGDGFEFQTLSFDQSCEEVAKQVNVEESLSQQKEVSDVASQLSGSGTTEWQEEIQEILSETQDLSISDISYAMEDSWSEDLMRTGDSEKPSDASHHHLNISASPAFCSYIADLAEACVLGELSVKLQRSHRKLLSTIPKSQRAESSRVDGDDGSGFFGDVSSIEDGNGLGSSYLDYLGSDTDDKAACNDVRFDDDGDDDGHSGNISNERKFASVNPMSTFISTVGYHGDDDNSDDGSVSYEGSDSEDDGWFDASDAERNPDEEDDDDDDAEEEALMEALQNVLQMDSDEDNEREMKDGDKDGAVTATLGADYKNEQDDDGSDLQDSGRFSATQSTKSETDSCDGSPIDTSTPLVLRRVDRLLPSIQEFVIPVSRFSEEEEGDESELCVTAAGESFSAVTDVKTRPLEVGNQSSVESSDSQSLMPEWSSSPKTVLDKSQQTDISLVCMDDDDAEAPDDAIFDTVSMTSPRKSFWHRVLRIAIPIYLILMLFSFIVIVLPTIIENLEGECSFSLTDQLLFSSLSWEPVLKYVKGPPPV